MKKYLLLLGLLLLSCSKDEQPRELCVWPVGEFADSVYLYDGGQVYGDPGYGYCIEEGFISFYAEPVAGYEFYKWCGYLDSWNSPMTSRFSNPVVLGRYGEFDSYKELEITPIYRRIGEAAPYEACDNFGD